ncbi:TIM44-like domain-containing protein [Candidatus Uabimicrobium amorphum]|uniref:Tim44-like domain-containing protein n=1 Tax=Uabimicrobium amorphum TaxID=2596890 RepID=A0A5S9IN42_UABAM|nr:TIM44-like domain-containing protein [Candidatus Uabimicrobium amorphum]BBM84110.1 hypothetical protein UABAM_02466 [Candidatus Uabimicrobium amorphum]
MDTRKLLFFTIVATVFCSPLYAGAGGTKGDGGASLIVILLLLPYLIGQATYIYLMRRRSKSDAWKVLDKAKNTDSAWNYEKLAAHTEKVFRQLQNFWSENNVDDSKAYLHKMYTHEYCRILHKNIRKGHFNRISNIKISRVDIVQAQNFIDDNKDMFVAHICGIMEDKVVTKSGQLIRNQGDSDDSPSRSIDEYWFFQRSGDDWLLRDIKKKHCALFDVSVDEENSVVVQEELMRVARASKSRYAFIAFLVGCGITTAGYLGYAAIFGALFNLF